MKRLLLLSALTLFACKDEAKPTKVAEGSAREKAGEAPASQPASKPAVLEGSKPHEPAKEPSTVAYKDKRCSGIAPCACAGSIMYGQNAIAKIGISEEDLAKGTPCLLADLDGNGTEDIVFVGKDYGKAPAVPVRVLLFDDLGLRDTPLFPKKVTTLSVHEKDGKKGLLEPSSRLFFVYENGKFEMKKI